MLDCCWHWQQCRQQTRTQNPALPDLKPWPAMMLLNSRLSHQGTHPLCCSTGCYHALEATMRPVSSRKHPCTALP